MKNVLMLLKKIYWFFKRLYVIYLQKTGDYKKLCDIRYYEYFHKHINWNNPKDLNEKINWLQIYTDTTLWTLCADKYRVRQYIVDKLKDDKNLVPLYAKWDKATDIDFSILPNKFVLKVNHGCGDAILVFDKNSIDRDKIVHQMDKALNNTFGIESSEPHYTRIKPCIIAEKLLETENPQGLVDYKLWCFNGEPFCFFTGSNRQISEHKVDFNLYSLEWERWDKYMAPAFRNNVQVRKPSHITEMIEIARKLSDGFPEVRIDFYEVNDQVYIGEMTFTSNGARNNFYTQECLDLMGDKIHIPDERA